MISASEVAKRLAERVESVCSMLLPGGCVQKSEYLSGSVCGGQGQSLKVNLNGGHAGKWRDWANQDDHRGDLLDLWRFSRGLSASEALKQAKEWLGVSDDASAAFPKQYKPAPEKTHPKINPAGRAFSWFIKTRLINAETLDAFKITVQPSETVSAIVFPCYSPAGELINRSYRTLPKDGEKKKVWQDTGCAPCLFGWQALPKSAFQRREVLLSEGQIDCMTWHQWGIPALSIPNGGGQTWIEYEWENLQVFDKIYIAFDSDEAGQENARRAISRLGPHRCFSVALPHKDANECLQRGEDGFAAQQWVSDAKAPSMNGIVVGSAMGNRVASEITAKKKPFTLSFFDKDWQFEQGLYFREGEVTLWTGNSFAGKSTFLNFLILGVLANEFTSFIASMEIKAEKTLLKLATAGLSVVGGRKDEPHFRSWLIEYGDKLILSDVVGYITQDKLIEMMRFSFQRFGASHHVIDSMMRIEGLEEDFPAQGMFLNKLQAFAKETGSHVHLVVHPRKMNNAKMGMFDVKGSSLIVNNADNVVIVGRNQEKMDTLKERELTDEEKAWHDTEIVVEKQRESGWVGAFYLKFNPYDFTYRVCEKTEKKQEKQFSPKKRMYAGY